MLAARGLRVNLCKNRRSASGTQAVGDVNYRRFHNETVELLATKWGEMPGLTIFLFCKVK